MKKATVLAIVMALLLSIAAPVLAETDLTVWHYTPPAMARAKESVSSWGRESR